MGKLNEYFLTSFFAIQQMTIYQYSMILFIIDSNAVKVVKVETALAV